VVAIVAVGGARAGGDSGGKAAARAAMRNGSDGFQDEGPSRPRSRAQGTQEATQDRALKPRSRADPVSTTAIRRDVAQAKEKENHKRDTSGRGRGV